MALIALVETTVVFNVSKMTFRQGIDNRDPSAMRRKTGAQSRWGAVRVCGVHLSHDAKVLELPRVTTIQVLSEQRSPVHERRPVAVYTDQVTQIGTRHVQHALVLEMISLNDASLRVLDSPDHAAKHGGRDLQTCRIVVRRKTSRLFDIPRLCGNPNESLAKA
jgi:hypothetical protein